MSIKPPFVRNPYNYDMNTAGDESALECKDKTLAQQHFREECDINTIVERFGLTGELPTNLKVPMQGDFLGIFDFQSAMNTVRAGQEAFAQMPANVRARFHNDAGEFLAFCQDPENVQEAIKLGIATPVATPSPESRQSDPEQTSGTKKDEGKPPATP